MLTFADLPLLREWTFTRTVFLSFALIPVLVVLWYILAELRSPLKRFPGPRLARYTRLWHLYHVCKGNVRLVLQEEHKKHGPVVRMAPNLLDVDFPELVKIILNTKEDYLKTEFYHASSVLGKNGKIIYNMFSQTNKELHAKEKRPVSKYYSMNGVLPLEPLIDTSIKLLCHKLDALCTDTAGESSAVDLRAWISYFAWDVVGETTFSQPFGYLAAGHDFDGMLHAAEAGVDYFTYIGCIPELDRLFDKNPIVRLGPPNINGLINFAIGHMVKRVQAEGMRKSSDVNVDFLDKFLEAKNTHPDIVDDAQVISYLMIPMLAGADTTSISINAVLYYSLKHPAVWKTLQDLIPAASSSSDNNDDVTSYKTARAIPYLEACIREALRLHPLGLPLQRYVPPSGLTLPNGDIVPPGTAIGLSPHTMNRNPTIFGSDAEVFRPERWLRDAANESEEAFAKRLAGMNATDLTFGGGSRICLGKHLGLMEMYKVIAELIRRFEIELVEPEREWEVWGAWFMRQRGWDVRVRRRV